MAFYDVAKAFDTVWIDGLFVQLWDMGICCARVQGHVSDWYHLKCGIHQGGYMSLIKYTAFINSLITKIKDSYVCCRIYRTPITPVGYADDLAACCRSEDNLNRVMHLVGDHRSV